MKRFLMSTNIEKRMRVCYNISSKKHGMFEHQSALSDLIKMLPIVGQHPKLSSKFGHSSSMYEKFDKFDKIWQIWLKKIGKP